MVGEKAIFSLSLLADGGHGTTTLTHHARRPHLPQNTDLDGFYKPWHGLREPLALISSLLQLLLCLGLVAVAPAVFVVVAPLLLSLILVKAPIDRGIVQQQREVFRLLPHRIRAKVDFANQQQHLSQAKVGQQSSDRGLLDIFPPCA